MPLTYPDQNALVALVRKARNPEFRKKLDAVLESGSTTVVCFDSAVDHPGG
jgi:hypothetical protein